MDDNHGIEAHIQAKVAQAESTTLEMIRTETVLSRLPVHNLAKKGRVDIRILKTTTTGEVELRWEVSYNERYGQARQLAYRLDTIVINQRIDAAGRPLPRILRIGSLNEICAELNVATHAGQNAKDLKRAFLQNASAFISAKFNYRANDRTERHVEAGITRYGVVFTGEKLPDGRKADAVYIVFNDPFWEVLNNAPVRPLDRAYMKDLPPAAQRFYEIVSYKIFSALKNSYPTAKISYSEYCTFSAQLRHLERQRVQDQMAKVLRPHKASGYIASVRYEPTIDAENKPDWILHLTPGERAHNEFAIAHGRKPKKTVALAAAGDELPPRRLFRRHEVPLAVVTTLPSPQPTFDPQLVAEFTRRGITEKKATELLANLKPGQDVIAQLEHTDYMVKNARIPIINPPGFYIRLIESNTSVPESFETSAKREAREEKERQERERRVAEDARQQLEFEYEDYCREQVEQYIALNPATFDAVKDAKWNENRARHQAFSDEMITTIAQGEAKREIAKQIPLLTLEEFRDHKKQGIPISLKPVPDLPPVDAVVPQPTVSEAAPAEASMPDAPLATTTGDHESAAVEELPGEVAGTPAGESAPLLLLSEPPIVELASEPIDPNLGDEGILPIAA